MIVHPYGGKYRYYTKWHGWLSNQDDGRAIKYASMKEAQRQLDIEQTEGKAANAFVAVVPVLVPFHDTGFTGDISEGRA